PAFLLGILLLASSRILLPRGKSNILPMLLCTWLLLVLVVAASTELNPILSGFVSLLTVVGLMFWYFREDLGQKLHISLDIWIGFGITGVYFLFWLFSSQQLRYLLPVVPFISIGIAYGFEKLGVLNKSFVVTTFYSLVLASLFAMLTSAAWFLQKAPLRVA